MGPRASLLYAHEDPWRISAFIFVLTQLLLTLLVLVHTTLVCITFQLMKWYGWWIPSCRNSVCGLGTLNLDPNASKSIPSVNAERFLNCSRNEDWWSANSKPLVCPKCHGVWSFKQRLSFKNDRGMLSQWGETPICSDVCNSRGSHVEAEVRSKHTCNAKTSTATDQPVGMKVCSEASSSVEKSVNSACRTKTCDGADQAAYGNLCFKTRKESVDTANTPIDIWKWPRTLVNEDDVFTDGLVEEVGSSSKVLVGDELGRVSLSSIGSEMTCHKLESSEWPWCVCEEMQDELVDEDLSVVTKRKVDGNDYGSENPTNGSRDEKLLAVMLKEDDRKCFDSESVIKGLKQAVQEERKKLCALYAELEVERIASETAANEAMSMISRLQEEKATLCMQAAHYQRMAEEKANYDEQAMQLLKEILYRKERENYLLEKEVKVMKTRFCKNVRKFGKKRHDVEKKSSFVKGEGTLLLTNVEEDSGLPEGQDMRNRVQEPEVQSSLGLIVSRVEKPPCSSRITEEQPLKRLKGINDHVNGTSQSTNLMSDTTHFAWVEGNEKTQNHVDTLTHNRFSIKEPIKDSQHYVVATRSSDSERISNFGLQKQVCENTPNTSKDGEIFSGVSVPLDLAQSASSAMDSGLESCHFAAKSKEKQKFFFQNGEETQSHNVSRQANELHNPDRSHKEAEIVCPNKGTSDFFTACSIDGVVAMISFSEASSSGMACPTNDQETPDQAGAKFLQCTSFDLKDHTKDLQARLKNFETDRMPRSCPSSMNNKGAGTSKFEEFLNDESCTLSVP